MNRLKAIQLKDHNRYYHIMTVVCTTPDCDFREEVKIPKGQQLSEMRCPVCLCRNLKKARVENETM